ncbi:MAG: glycerol-3-phosphate dehydrogenase [Acetobacteraceae bacterium]|nr:glycerol-3-phosphate dehydrogenase [Acetobacteraceae bacterium]
MSQVFDLAIVGGGINGAGIARDAAGRGLSVLLMEQGDLASATSSASTKLIHGGLRYLEYREFRLVRESLTEREVLLRAAPDIIHPLRFVLPYRVGGRPWWMLRSGLFLYDHIGGRRILPPTRTLNFRIDPAGEPLQDNIARGFEYSDCWADDARLVVLTVRDAADHGADIRPRTRCETARAEDGLWALRLSGGAEERARVLVNAAGPYVSRVLSDVVGQTDPVRIRLVKGSHIVVKRLFAHDRPYILQNHDGRVCFAIPYQTNFTLIGTTDEDYEGDPAEATISAGEIEYLCRAVSAWFRHPVAPADVVWTYTGVRPLRDDGATAAQEATRDYVLELTGTPPVLSVFGGKLTTFRRLAEAAMDRLAPLFPGMASRWTANAHLPGGDFPRDGLPALRDGLVRRYPFLPAAMAARLAQAYGTCAPAVLGDAGSMADLGGVFGADLTEREVDWLKRQEWARTAEDVLWRRTKLGLRFAPEEVNVLERSFAGSS